MLKYLHRSWDDLQLVESDTVLSGLETFFSQARALLDDFLRDKSVAGFKDPRFSLLLPFWKKAQVRLPVTRMLRDPEPTHFQVAGRSIFNISEEIMSFGEALSSLIGSNCFSRH